MKPTTRQPSRAQVERALKNLALLWRPPDPENGNVPEASRGARVNKLNQSDLTAASASRKAAAAPFDSIADTIAGQDEGSRFVRDLCDDISAPDAMFMRLREIAGNAAKMRGFCRALQKYIERRPA